jgi:lycopene beta-cyclase
MSKWDLVIAGAGLAGLALGCELTQDKFSRLRILIIEPRTQYVRDRTWSYWAHPDALPARWKGLAPYAWKRWRVSHQGADVIQEVATGSPFGYATLPADVFYAQALAVIRQAKHIELRLGEGLQQVQRDTQGWALELRSGQQVQTAWLVDTRPPVSQESQDWVQHFEGWEIETSQPCFDPQCVDLMAFESHPQSLNFLYCLPMSSQRALVESTWISRAAVKADYAAQIKQALRSRWAAGSYEVIFREQGALPLWPTFEAPQQQCLRMGRAGGALRASTGYAFTASLKHAEQVASSLQQHLQSGAALHQWPAPQIQRNAWEDWMDRVLFQVLEQDWLQAPGYFMQMFQATSPQTLIRFLSGHARWADRLAVMRALPIKPFARAALGLPQ